MVNSRINLFHGAFLLVFTAFMVIMIGGLLFYGEWAAFLSVIKNPEFRFAVVLCY